MQTCPDCEYVEKQVEGNPNFEVIDIGKHVRNLKQFLKLRDTNPAFDERRLWMTLESHVMCWRMERLRSIRRTWDWSQGHRRTAQRVVLTGEGAKRQTKRY